MELNLKKLENCRNEFSAELNYEELQPLFEKALIDYKKKVTIPGFRKGKAPLHMVKKMYGDSVEYASLEDIANEIFTDYLRENHVDIIDKATLKDIDYKPKEKLTFVIDFESYPEIELSNYKNLELTKDKYIISDEMVDEEIRNIQYGYAQYEMDSQAFDDEYRITIDTQNLDETGNIIVGENTKDFQVYLGNKNMFPEFREGFKNIKEGEERIIETKDGEGKPKKLKVTCKKVEKIIYPELNEEFFKKVTNKELKTPEDFRAHIKNEIENYYNGISDRKLENDMISEMIKLNDIEVPEKFINRILDTQWEDEQKAHKNHKHAMEEESEFKKRKRVDAIKSAKWFLIKEKILEIEKFEITDDDYIKLAQENLVRYNLPMDAAKLAESYKENKDIRYHILDDKIFNMIKSGAQIKEVERDMKAEQQENQII